MSLRIFNSLTKRKEEFHPLVPGKVRMYVCGVTVYDFCHIGHARSAVLFDVIYRYLKASGFDVTYVRNFTDIDDKIINRANQLGEKWDALAQRFIDEFYVDMDGIGVLRPDHEPRATRYIEQILELIKELIEKDFAYVASGDVIFPVNKFKEYGELSGKRIDDLLAGARVDVDKKKKNPLDFVLWKAAKPGEPSWDSPWGPGRPGWHIECSAMSMALLGESFDIHGGGADLIFPHHENEIAQSECATGKHFVRYWIHNGFVNISSEKMSKSLGNQLNIRDIRKEVHPEALRLFLLSSHYRSPLDYNDNSIRESSVGLERLYSAMVTLDKFVALSGKSDQLPPELTNVKERFSEAMDDDFNSPRGLAVLFDASRAINRFSAPGTKLKSVPKPELLSLIKQEIISLSRDVFGIITEEPRVFLDNLRKRRLSRLGLQEKYVEDKIAERNEARKNKDFGLADRIRKELSDHGISLEDSPQGTEWRIDSEQKQGV